MSPPSIYSITAITGYIKSLFTSDLLLGDISLSGEVSNFKQATSGHCYFTLKDARSSIKSIMWRTAASHMLLPQDGDEVIAHGSISVYEPQGVYQFYVDRLETAGVGRLWQEFERLKERLASEGLFEAERKRPLPPLPARLGVVTSASAAALQDILRTLANRYPLVEVIVAPAPVQGDQAPPGIVAAIEALNRWSLEKTPLDAIIVARGGGSIEELWAFNDERVARAIFTSQVPVIAGVGHETDFTIADFVADVRSPTPTGAAALAVPDARELSAAVQGLAASALQRLTVLLADKRQSVDGVSTRLGRASPAQRLAQDRQRVDEVGRRAQLAIENRLTNARERLAGQKLILLGLDPSRVLARGYALVTHRSGAVVSSIAQVGTGDVLDVRVVDGTFAAEVTSGGETDD